MPGRMDEVGKNLGSIEVEMAERNRNSAASGSIITDVDVVGRRRIGAADQGVETASGGQRQALLDDDVDLVDSVIGRNLDRIPSRGPVDTGLQGGVAGRGAGKGERGRHGRRRQQKGPY